MDFILIFIRANELAEDGEESRNDSLSAEEYDVGQRETDGPDVESIVLEWDAVLANANFETIAHQDPVEVENFGDPTSKMKVGDGFLDDNDYVSILEIDRDDEVNASSGQRETDEPEVESIELEWDAVLDNANSDTIAHQDPVGGEKFGDTTSEMNDGDERLDETGILEIERDDEANAALALDAVKAELFAEPFNVALLCESLGAISNASDCVITAEYEVEFD